MPDDELDELRAIAGDIGTEPVAWETPPADLWQRIAAEVAGDEPAATPITTAPSRRPRHVWRWAAAAAVVAIVVAGAIVWARDSDDALVVASAQLDRLGDSGEGSAELVERDGGYQLRLTTSDLGVGNDDFAEVWIINTEVTELISLGPLRPDGTYELPPGLDPMTFPIVDVSVEPLDGDPTHSGNSVLRGQLLPTPL